MDNKSSRRDIHHSSKPRPARHRGPAGKLDYVRFTADSSNGTHKEWRLAAALLDKKLHVLESSGMRYGIVSKLHSGARADLPGTYSIKQLADLGLPDPR